MLRHKSSSLLLLASMCFLSPDTGGAGTAVGMTQPTPAAPDTAGKPPVEPVKEYADTDFTPAAMKWRAEHGKAPTQPTSTVTEGEGGAASAISAGMPQGVEAGKEADESEGIEAKRKSLEPAPRHFDHISGEKPDHDNDEALKANGRAGEVSEEAKEEAEDSKKGIVHADE